ncbi:hypothetical protein [Nostoc sp.]|uniref:hypothetical protein n=1 Tax=Nostoc sp. TaxID=1180 RepID=UPI002FF89F0B
MKTTLRLDLFPLNQRFSGRLKPINSLFAVDINTGEMMLVRQLAVLKIAFA